MEMNLQLLTTNIFPSINIAFNIFSADLSDEWCSFLGPQCQHLLWYTPCNWGFYSFFLFEWIHQANYMKLYPGKFSIFIWLREFITVRQSMNNPFVDVTSCLRGIIWSLLKNGCRILFNVYSTKCCRCDQLTVVRQHKSNFVSTRLFRRVL